MTTQTQVVKFNSALIQLIIWTVLGEIVAPVAVGIVVWLFGAGYTIAALQWIARAFFDVSPGPLWYAASIVFSVVELGLFKLKGSMSREVHRLAIGMAAVDLLTTTFGLFLALVNDYLPRLGIQTLDTKYLVAAGLVALLASWWVTFSPEKYLVNAVLQAIEITKLFRGRV